MLKKKLLENLSNQKNFKHKFLISLIVVFIDQTSKILVRNFIKEGDKWPENFNLLFISHVENTGAAFGIFQGFTNLLTIITFFTLLGLLYFMLKIGFTSHWQNLGLSLILGGAIGNFLDRLIRGSVTDFIDPIYYPAFNIADSSIVIGTGLILLFAIVDRNNKEIIKGH